MLLTPIGLMAGLVSDTVSAFRNSAYYRVVYFCAVFGCILGLLMILKWAMFDASSATPGTVRPGFASGGLNSLSVLDLVVPGTLFAILARLGLAVHLAGDASASVSQ